MDDNRNMPILTDGVHPTAPLIVSIAGLKEARLLGSVLGLRLASAAKPPLSKGGAAAWWGAERGASVAELMSMTVFQDSSGA